MRTLLYLILAIAGFPIAMFAPDSIFFGFNIKALYLLILVLILSLPTLLNSSEVIKSARNIKFLILFFIYATFSLAWTVDIIYGFRFLIKIYSIILIIFAVTAFIKNESQIRLCERSIFIICFIVGNLAIINYVLGGTKHTLAWGMFASLNAPTTSPANFSFLMSCGSLLAFANFYASMKTRYLLLFVFFTLAVLWAYTRISIISLMISLLIIQMLMSGKFSVKKILLFSIISILMLSLISSYGLKERMFYDSNKVQWSDITNDTEYFFNNINTSGRTNLWGEAVRHFSDNDKSILFGSGSGATDEWLSKVTYVNALHSDYLRIYLDLGIIGILLFLGGIFSVTLTLIKMNNKGNTKYERKWPAIGVSGLLFYSLTLFTDNSLNYFLDFGIYIFCFVAFAFVYDKQKIPKKLR